ncbi:hypothetical protein DID88_003647 [Monilinia fructigena]|uniref:Uncharacterized protein n=1 Tax=Monilinia fructigena TaxID=38457 RepID=A0A395IW16_9HELO|nr:hypothetical protein DID88_003647 [Monilinia fructigena]
MHRSIALATLISFALSQGTTYTYSDGSSVLEYYISMVVYYEPSSYVSIYSSPQPDVFSTDSLEDEVLFNISTEHSSYYGTSVPLVSEGTEFVWNTAAEPSTIFYTSGDESSYDSNTTATSGFNGDEDEDAWDPETLEAMEYWVAVFNNTYVLSFDETIRAVKQVANGDGYENLASARHDLAAVRLKKRPISKTPKPKTLEPKKPKHNPSPKPKPKCSEPKKPYVCPIPPQNPPITPPHPYT